MEMQHVRVGNAPQVPVPPVSARPLEISKEMRQQLRVTRHRAYERHQENAQWTKELLEGGQSQAELFVTPNGRATSVEELQKQVKAKKEEADELERQLIQQKEAQETTQRRFEDMLTMLKTAGDDAALKQCQEQVDVEKALLVTSKPRKMEIVRL
ncbi:putative membrane protein [Phytophthora megakarya]|uniref:Putative membrane protein n=1 Tax=Phytophthora megakarya TaxID=4795 RepID=A0A225W715_9STRA|nr:putative membrane protein [Phytophthora megakarya]